LGPQGRTSVDFALFAGAVSVVFKIEEELSCIMQGIKFQVRALHFAGRILIHISLQSAIRLFQNNACFGASPK
jgi:hypothetical protein